MNNKRFYAILVVLSISLGLLLLGFSAAHVARASTLPPEISITRASTEPEELARGMQANLPAATSSQINDLRVYTSTSTPLPIPDTGCSTILADEINIPDSYKILDLNVGFIVAHPERSQVEATLIAPDNTVITLAQALPGSVANLNVKFDQESMNPPEPIPHNLPPPYYPYTWMPVGGDLNLVNGKDSAGLWKLEVCDNLADGQAGTLWPWSLWFEVPFVEPVMQSSYIVAPAKIPTGTTIPYRIVIQNWGLLTASQALLTDYLPAGTAYISGSLSCSTGSCVYNIPSKTVEWTGIVSPNADVTVTFDVQTPPYGAGPYTNTGVITDPDLTTPVYLHTAAYAVPTIISQWDFELDNGSFYTTTPGSEWSWGNVFTGPHPFHSGPIVWGTGLKGMYAPSRISSLFKVIDLSGIPADAKPTLQWWEWYDLDESGDFGALLINGEIAYQFFGDHLEWTHRQIDLSVYTDQVVTLEWVLNANNDLNVGYGWHIDEVSLHPAALPSDLALGKLGTPALVVAGDFLTYTLAVTNTSPNVATGVVLTDHLPVSTTFVTSSLPGCGLVGRDVICTLDDLAPGMITNLQIIARVDPLTPPGQITNLAIVSALEPDLLPDNNSATASNRVISEPIIGPKVTDVTPAFGINTLPTPIDILGINFEPESLVKLGNLILTDTTFVTPQRLQTVVPAGLPPGTYHLSVMNPDNTSYTRLDAFSVAADQDSVITGIWPPKGLNDIPVTIDIYGEYFVPGMGGELNGGVSIPLDFIYFLNSTHLRALVPINIPPGIYTLSLIHPLNGQVSNLADAYQSLDPLTYDDLMAYPFNLWVDPPGVMMGEDALAGLLVHRNGGTTSLLDVPVDFYLQGINLGSDMIEMILPRSRVAATINWTAPLTAGTYLLSAEIDPDNLYDESDETNNVITRTLRVRHFDSKPLPIIQQFSIDDRTPTTNDRQVSLNVVVDGNPAWLYYIEFVFIQSENTWMPVAHSDWLPYAQASVNFPWRLAPVPGVHYIQVWAGNVNGGISRLPGRALINLLPSQAQIAAQEGHIFRLLLPAGSSWLVRLTSLVGDADLYIWAPDGSEIGRSELGDPIEIIQFSAPVSGVYQIEVEGFTPAVYHLDVIRLNTVLNFLEADEVWTPGLSNQPGQRGRGRPLSEVPPSDDFGLPEVPRTYYTYFGAVILR